MACTYMQYSPLTNWGVVIIMVNNNYNEGIITWAKMSFKRLVVCDSLIDCGKWGQTGKVDLNNNGFRFFAVRSYSRMSEVRV